MSLLTEPGTGIDDLPPAFVPRPASAIQAKVPGRWVEVLAIGAVTVMTQLVIHAAAQQPPQPPVVVQVAAPPVRLVTVQAQAPICPQPEPVTPTTVPAATPVPTPTQATAPTTTPDPATSSPEGLGGLLDYLKTVGYVGSSTP